MRNALIVGFIALLAVASLFLIGTPSLTGAAVSNTNNYLTVSVSGTHGTLSFKNYDKKTVKIPLTYENGRLYFGKGDDVVYVDSQTCADDCVGQQFLVLLDNYAHLMKITKLETGKISIKDSTYNKESYDNAYIDGAPITLAVGDVNIVLTITGNSVAFTDIGTSSVKLIDKGSLEVGSSFIYREPQGTTFSAEKYIGRGGSNPLTITVYYDTNVNSLQIKSILMSELTKTLGSGWYNTKGVYSFYSNKGTLITYTKSKVSVGKL
jgi:hypothetical protein